ncbi:relaxase/mobilization nuclease domain-containing protein [Sphingomonas sp. PAMC 26621]|uniref:relaxase/mobilization nuclease domain-containing protein n=1 Tax=Sphingomonas sp. PAMC 26621 TaxID=1112213 RepID=UPI0011113FE3|nr:relaxase/mobilization nuclease domain-containing protein [Sphingomonas sp. PAMC 26621]
MSDGPKIEFLDTTWRAPAGGKTTGSKGRLNIPAGKSSRGGGGGSVAATKAKLQRITNRVPEVMVKVSGRQRGGAHTAAHLEYIGRHGKLEVETSDGEKLESVKDLRELAQDWAEDEAATTKRREPLTSISLVLSMPPGTDPDTVYQAARAFARTELERFPYAMALHTDADHPHVHLTVAARGEGGERFNPRKDDLAGWRESFARELRARGIEAEATPRRARGVIQKMERTPIRKIRDRAEAGTAELPRVLQSSRAEAAAMAQEKPAKARPWEVSAIVRQSEVRASYEKAASELDASADPADRKLAQQTRAFVASMPDPMTRDRDQARQMAEATRNVRDSERDREGKPVTRAGPVPPARSERQRPTQQPQPEQTNDKPRATPRTPKRPDRTR